jgi:hypothetical protein
MEQEHERIYSLMMSVLDEEVLTAAESAEMDALLLQNPDLAHEWEAMRAVDRLFRQSAVIIPPLGFAERTMERLPAFSRQRIWAVTAFYLALLVGGLIPILAGLWLFTAYGDVISQVALFQAFNQTVGVAVQSGIAVIGAIGVITADTLLEQPFLMGWVCLLIGIVAMWRNVYNYMLRPRTVARATV